MHLTHSERNRRLIPYTSYYIAGNQEVNGHDTANIEHGHQLDYTASTLKPKPPIIVNQNTQKIQYDYVDYQQNPIAGYNYVPVAYIPGNSAVPLSLVSNSQYYPAYYQDDGATQDANLYTTARPSYVTSTNRPNSGVKDEQVSYLRDYLLPSTSSPQNAFIKYVLSLIHISEPTRPY